MDACASTDADFSGEPSRFDGSIIYQTRLRACGGIIFTRDPRIIYI